MTEVGISMSSNYIKIAEDALLHTYNRYQIVLEKGEIIPKKQDDSKSCYAHMITKETSNIDWNNEALSVHNLIRGRSPIPLSFTHTPDGKLLKVVASEIKDEDSENRELPGTVVALDGRITIACGKGKIDLLTVIPEGKSRMNSADYIRGRKLNVGDILK